MNKEELIQHWEEELFLYKKLLKGLHPQFDESQHIHYSASKAQLERCLIELKQLNSAERN